MDLKHNEFKIEETVSSEVHKVDIKWSREKLNKLHGRYRKGLKGTQMKKQKPAHQLENEALKIFNV